MSVRLRTLHADSHRRVAEVNKRETYLQELLSWFDEEDGDVQHDAIHEIYPYGTWRQWQAATGELPPDFDELPSLPFLPDLLVLDEGRTNRKVCTYADWIAKREEMAQRVQHWITGALPPAPEEVRATLQSERREGEVTVRELDLRFGPEFRASVRIELFIPNGRGRKPVFLTQWNHREWALLGLRRGYIGCRYAAADRRDDTDAWRDLYVPDYDFTKLMRRAWAAHRVVDYLVQLDEVRPEHIAIAGHSRNGKQSLMAAAFDERIGAVVPSSSGTGGDIPYRYATDKFRLETIKVITARTPSWLHPRLRFFVGREHKLPADQTFLQALVAPRGLLYSSALTEGYGNPWAIEKAFESVKRAYDFLGASDSIALNLRRGRHGTVAADLETYFDFFDFVFDRGSIRPPTRRYWDYTFSRWQGHSGEMLDPRQFPVREIDDPTEGVGRAGWERRKPEILERIRWALGEEPPGAVNTGPGVLDSGGLDDYLSATIGRPQETNDMKRAVLHPYQGVGDCVEAYLYYPAGRDDHAAGGESTKLPVLVYLHGYSYPTGFSPYWPYTNAFSFEEVTAQGWAVLALDLIGFGTRIDEGTGFYERYPHWSKLGKMVADVRATVDALAGIDVVDSTRIVLFGYELGSLVGLHAAALDDRVYAAAVCGGFTPFRTLKGRDDVEGVRALSHLHGLQPRLGFFVGEEDRMPYDYHEALSCVAPRPLLVICPRASRDVVVDDVLRCVDMTRRVYDAYGKGRALTFSGPDYYNQFSRARFDELLSWLDSIR